VWRAAAVAFVFMYAAKEFPTKDRQFERCRADWLVAFKPSFSKPLTEFDADYQFVRSCMAAKGFNPRPENTCPAGTAVTHSDCYVSRWPWE